MPCLSGRCGSVGGESCWGFSLHRCNPILTNQVGRYNSRTLTKVSRLKVIAIFLLFIAAPSAWAQTPISTGEALGQLYQSYDESTKTAQWVCPNLIQPGDPCWSGEDATVEIRVVLTAEVSEGDIQKTYLIASAKPSKADAYVCHFCAPAIGIAVFAWQSNRWVLQSKNPAVGFFGSFGIPGGVALVAVAPQKHGVMISNDYGGQGVYESTKSLFLPLATDIKQVWSLKDQDDDTGEDFDDKGRWSDRVRHHLWANENFYWTGSSEDDANSDYYGLSVISHRTSWRVKAHWVKQDYWQDTYKFNGSKYLRVTHEQITSSNSSSARTKR